MSIKRTAYTMYSATYTIDNTLKVLITHVGTVSLEGIWFGEMDGLVKALQQVDKLAEEALKCPESLS